MSVNDELTFPMGRFQARFPADRQYAKNHMWAAERDGVHRFGLTAYAVGLLQDVYFLEWGIDADRQVEQGQEIGVIESKKAESALFAPIAGHLTRFNEALLRDPSTINADPYGDGWLLEILGSQPRLLSAPQYVEHVESAWQRAQCTIKGQWNQ